MYEVEKFGHKIRMSFGSSTGNPDFKGMQTSDIREWIKFGDIWFKAYGSFTWRQIQAMIDICKTEYQLICLMNMLSAVDAE